MKKTSTWMVILGAIIIISTIFSLANSLTNPTNLYSVNVAINISNLAWLFFGVFIIIFSLKNENIKQIGDNKTDVILDSTEDLILLQKRRNYILGYVFLFGMIGSIETWILNDYTAGFTLFNIIIILDLLINAFILYLVAQLFKNKTNILSTVFYVVTAYLFMWVLIEVFRGYWFASIFQALLAIYVVFVIKAKTSRKNYKVANFIILPIIIIFILAFGSLDDKNIITLQKNESLLEQQFAVLTGNIDQNYYLFLQKESPSSIEIKNIKDLIANRDIKIKEIGLSINNLEIEYHKQLPSVSQKKTLENLRYFLMIMENHKNQTAKLMELMNYVENINFANITEKQKIQISSLKNQINDYNYQLTKINFDWTNSNLQ